MFAIRGGLEAMLQIGYRMSWDADWIPYAGAAVTATIVAVGFSLLGLWISG